MVACALGMVAVRKAVHSALLLAVVMICLAVLYAAQDAPFLFAVQIIVYTGAVLMLFLFVLMLVGVDSSDSLVETIRGQRVAAVFVGVVFAVLVVAGITQTTYRSRRRPRRGQHGRQRPRRRAAAVQQLRLRLRGDERPADHGGARRDGARPPRAAHARSRRSGISVLAADARLRRARASTPARCRRPVSFARHNSVDTPALLPDGTPSELSISRVMRARGTVRDVDGSRVEAETGRDRSPRSRQACQTTRRDCEGGDER